MVQDFEALFLVVSTLKSPFSGRGEMMLSDWQARRDSNSQHPDLESGALPLELLAFIRSHFVSL